MTSPETTDLRYRRLRGAIANLDPVTVRETLRAVNPQVLAQAHPALRTSIGRLRGAKDPVASLALPHFQPAMEYVAQAVTVDCLDAVRSALGPAADDPSTEQLRAALAEVSSTFTPDIVAALLALTAAIDAPAAEACDAILGSEAVYGVRDEDLDALEPSAPTGMPAARSAGPRSGNTKKRAKKGGRAGPVHQPWKHAKAATTEQAEPSSED